MPSKKLESYEQTVTAEFVVYDCDKCIEDLTNNLQLLIGGHNTISGKVFVGKRLVIGGGRRHGNKA